MSSASMPTTASTDMSSGSWPSLQPYHTFGLPVRARKISQVAQLNELLALSQASLRANEPLLILGSGSNMLFTEDFAGHVILNRLRGIECTESEQAWHLHVAAGENWHQLIEYTLAHNLAGMENLALIPGCCGSAPIQNIGAYGVEFEQICEYVDVLALASGEIFRLTRAECQFGYRDSVFKHRYQQGYVITAVGLCLSKNWQPVLSYGDLTQFDPATVTATQIFETVCQMRQSKLPDPAVQGNAGSFFKNPLVSAELLARLRQDYPAIPCYAQPNGQFKLAAGWLIDQCGLKGFQIGGAAVHERQALVLVNQGQATASDVLQLAHSVRQQVLARFAVALEPEVRFMGADGEINAVQAIA